MVNTLTNKFPISTPQPFRERVQNSGDQPIGLLMQQAIDFPNLISLAAGFVDNQTLPSEIVKQIAPGLLDADYLQQALQYGSTQGDTELRQAILDFAYRPSPSHAASSREGRFQPAIDQIVLTAGSNAFLHLLAHAIVEPGDIVLTASPTYFVYLSALESLGARCVSVASDEQGMRADALLETLARLESMGQGNRIKAVYLVPFHDNPGGTNMGEVRQRDISDAIHAFRNRGFPTILIADYAYQELGFDASRGQSWREIDAACDQFVFEAGTFSKSFSPGNRIGWGVCPPDMVESIVNLKANIDFGSPHLNQMLMKLVLKSGKLESHLAILRSRYSQKCQVMLDACSQYLGGIDGVQWLEPSGGLYIWVTLPQSLPANFGSALHRAAVEKGVLYVPGNFCFPESSEVNPLSAEQVAANDASMRLTFGVATQDQIRDGVRLLGEAIRDAA